VHVTFDRDGRVTDCTSFRQRCKECVERGESFPLLHAKALREVIAHAIAWARLPPPPRQGPRDIADDSGERKGPPHLSHLCERCNYGPISRH
jgi:hypothetical protein